MTIAATTTATSTTTSSSTSSSSDNSVSSTYSIFLKLLTTQLKNQDPTNAMDPTTFTNELISLTGVEQQEKTNTQLTTIANTLSSLTASNGLGYIGKTVEATGSTAPLQSGAADWNYNLASTAASVTLTVSDSSGNTVYSASGDTASGKHSFSWNGTETSGTTVTSGDYTLTVSATDSAGNTVSSTTTALGKVTGVDTSSGTTSLAMGDLSVALSNITSVTN